MRKTKDIEEDLALSEKMKKAFREDIFKYSELEKENIEMENEISHISITENLMVTILEINGVNGDYPLPNSEQLDKIYFEFGVYFGGELQGPLVYSPHMNVYSSNPAAKLNLTISGNLEDDENPSILLKQFAQKIIASIEIWRIPRVIICFFFQILNENLLYITIGCKSLFDFDGNYEKRIEYCSWLGSSEFN